MNYVKRRTLLILFHPPRLLLEPVDISRRRTKCGGKQQWFHYSMVFRATICERHATFIHWLSIHNCQDQDVPHHLPGEENKHDDFPEIPCLPKLLLVYIIDTNSNQGLQEPEPEEQLNSHQTGHRVNYRCQVDPLPRTNKETLTTTASLVIYKEVWTKAAN